MSTETTQNSEVLIQIRPDELMNELGIKKDAYYGDLKFLGLKPKKDGEGKVYLEDEQANQVRALRSYMLNNDGKREGFSIDGGAIATTEPNSMASEAHLPEQPDPCSGIDHEELYLEASNLAAAQMTMGQQVVLAMASQMGYEDLHPVAKAKVDSLREATTPKFQPQAIAAQLLDKIRSQSNDQKEQVTVA